MEMEKVAVKDVMDLPVVLTMKHVQRVLDVSRPIAYELAHRQGFPVVRFGRAIRVPREAFLAWLRREAGQLPGGHNSEESAD